MGQAKNAERIQDTGRHVIGRPDTVRVGATSSRGTGASCTDQQPVEPVRQLREILAQHLTSS